MEANLNIITEGKGNVWVETNKEENNDIIILLVEVQIVDLPTKYLPLYHNGRGGTFYCSKYLHNDMRG